MERKTTRRILPLTKDFKAFWKKQGPFRYAITSSEFPPILLEPEEWIFSDNIIWLFKDLMQWDSRDMAIISAPFNKNKRNMLKPESLAPWKIEHFPQEWERSVCDTFTPLGYLTESVTTIALSYLNSGALDPVDICNIETAFFKSLETDINKIGYVLLKPEQIPGNEDVAYIRSYLEEWQADEDEELLQG